MSAQDLSEFEIARARKLGQELTDRLSGFAEREFSDEEINEVKRIRTELEKMGFRVEWSAGFDIATGKGTAKVQLWIPKVQSAQTEHDSQPQA